MKRYLSLGACFMFLFGLSQCVVGVELSPLKEGEALKADFSQFRSLSTLPKPMTSTGQLVLWQGKGILWETKTPFPNMILINKNGLFQINEGKPMRMGQTNQTDIIFGVVSKIIEGSFLTGLNGFIIDETLPNSSSNTWRVKLIPTHPQLKKILKHILVEGADVIQCIEIMRLNGDKDQIRFSKHKTHDKSDIDILLEQKYRDWFNG